MNKPKYTIGETIIFDWGDKCLRMVKIIDAHCYGKEWVYRVKFEDTEYGVQESLIVDAEDPVTKFDF